MTHGYGEETPAAKISTANTSLLLALRLYNLGMSGNLSPEIYSNCFSIETPTGIITIPSEPDKSGTELELELHNLVILSLGSSAIIVDEALNNVYGSKDPSISTGMHALRSMVYQMRNAFAHNMIRPRWEIKDKYNRKYEIDIGSEKFVFNATVLNSLPLQPEHIGDLLFWSRLMDFCCRSVVKQ